MVTFLHGCFRVPQVSHTAVRVRDILNPIDGTRNFFFYSGLPFLVPSSQGGHRDLLIIIFPPAFITSLLLAKLNKLQHWT